MHLSSAGATLSFRRLVVWAVAEVLLGVRLVVLRQVRFLAKTLAADGAREGFLARVRADVHVDRVLVLEALAADGAIVQRSFLADAAVGHGGHGGVVGLFGS